MRSRACSLFVLLSCPALLAAAPSKAPVQASEQAPSAEFVLDCYVVQSSALELGQFIRHLRVLPKRGVVSVSDAVQGRAPRFIGDGRIVALDANHLSYDFASYRSSGRTEVDRRTGGFHYGDGRSVISGTCQEGGV